MKQITLILLMFILVVVGIVHGQWFDQYELICDDGQDNDLDGLVDGADPDCFAFLKGTVTDESLSPLPSATVDLLDEDLNIIATTQTDSSGNYILRVPPNVENHVVFSHVDFASNTVSDLNLLVREEFIQDSTLTLDTACDSDCTFSGDEIIHSSCADINGCNFYDEIATVNCDNARVGWTRDYDADNFVVCPSGPLQPKTPVDTEVTCADENLIKVTRVVSYQGKLAKLVVVTCG